MIVTHKLTGQKMRVKKLGKYVSVCYLPEPIKSKFGYDIEVCICKNTNLIFETNQLSLI